MIKKLNKEIDNIPLVIKIILCIAMIILITLISTLFIGVVKAEEYYTNTIYLRDTNGNYHGYSNTSRQTVGYNTNLINYQWTTYQGGIVDSTVTLRIYNYNRPQKPQFTIVVTENGAPATYYSSDYSCDLQWNESQLSGQLECTIHVIATLQGGNYWEIQMTPRAILPYIDFQAYGSAIIVSNGSATAEDIQNQTIQIINNQNANYQAYMEWLELTNTTRWTEEDEQEQEQTGILRNIMSGISNIFSNLFNSSVDNPQNALNQFNNKFADNNVISNLLLLPVRIYQNVLNNINGTCNTFNLGALWNHNLTMTCIRVDSLLGSALYGVIDVIISGFFVYHIRKKFVDIFEHLTSLKTGGNELE